MEKPLSLSGKNGSRLRDQINFMTKSSEERLCYISALIAWTPQMNEIYNQIEECQKGQILKDEPICMSILGESRTGKTTIAKQYVRRNPRYELKGNIVKTPHYPKGMSADITCTPVIYIIVDSPPSSGSILDSIGQALGHPPFPPRTTNHAKLEVLRYLMSVCKVELIIMDEIYNIIDPKNHLLMAEPSEWLKTFIIKTNIPLLIIGTPDSKKIFRNEQINNRFLYRKELLPFNYSNEKDRYSFRKVLQEIDDNLPFMNESGLARNDTWERILLVCNGYMGHCMEFIKLCAQAAVNSGQEMISNKILSYIYDKHYSFLAICEGNPFSPNYPLEEALGKHCENKLTSNRKQEATNNRMNSKKNKRTTPDMPF